MLIKSKKPFTKKHCLKKSAIILSISILALVLIFGCSKKAPEVKTIIKKIPEKKKIVKPKKPVEPVFIPYKPLYDPKKRFTKKDLEPLTKMELALLRVQIYNRYNYEFESIWKKNFFKERLGSPILKPDYFKLVDFSKIDKWNDSLLINVLYQKRKSKNSVYNLLPYKVEHIMKKVNFIPKNSRYYLSVSDAKPILFEKDEIPSGISKPTFGHEISLESWKKLISGKKTFTDLGFPEGQKIVYLINNYKNKTLFIISFEAFGGKLSHQDYKNFSIYDKNGILRRSIYVVGNQEIYERDYYYNKNNDVETIVEKIKQDKQLLHAYIFKRNPKAKIF